MAFTALIRRSASTIAQPLARRAAQAQRHHHSAVFTALNRSIFPPKPSSSVVSTDVFFQSRHDYSSSSPALKRPSSDAALVRIIESEIQCALESENSTRVRVKEIPGDFPFKIEDTPGEQTISLKREYQGESIVVEVSIPDLVGFFEEDESEEDDNIEDTGASVPLVVTVSKKNNGLELEFDLTAYADEIEINSMILRDPEATKDQLAYEGCDFSDLDENLQKAFQEYLEIRGIKPSTADFLFKYMVHKDAREYTQWLINLKKFVEAKV